MFAQSRARSERTFSPPNVRISTHTPQSIFICTNRYESVRSQVPWARDVWVCVCVCVRMRPPSASCIASAGWRLRRCWCVSLSLSRSCTNSQILCELYVSVATLTRVVCAHTVYTHRNTRVRSLSELIWHTRALAKHKVRVFAKIHRHTWTHIRVPCMHACVCVCGVCAHQMRAKTFRFHVKDDVDSDETHNTCSLSVSFSVCSSSCSVFCVPMTHALRWCADAATWRAIIEIKSNRILQYFCSQPQMVHQHKGQLL